LRVHYERDLEYLLSPARAPLILGVTGYGAARPAGLHPACPFVAAPLQPAATGDKAYEVWTADTPAMHIHIGPVAGSCSAEAAFGALVLGEAQTIPLEQTVERAYLHIFDFLDQTGFREPVRFWNYLTAITEDEQGMERYRRFNTGRQNAFMARLRQPAPPAASGVGGHHGASVIYFLAARMAGEAIENPRQISAYAYPPVYGPTSPSFSRASRHGNAGAQSLFISGTASIVGHETRHRGDVRAQLAETMENLRALMQAAGCAGQPGGWAVKTYLRDPSCRAAVDRAVTSLFGSQSQRLHLQGDICRDDLLLEIEACHLPQP
jgi:enamine deaminase RidA (YjgF/YER057c/UK114 family)